MLFIHNSCSEQQNPRTWKNSTTLTSNYHRLCSDAELSTLCTQGPALLSILSKAPPSVHMTRKSFSSPSHDLSCSAQPTKSAPTGLQIQKQTPMWRQHRLVLFQSALASPPVGLWMFGRSGLLTGEQCATHLTALHIFCCASQVN